jgi:hypothetical protein
MCCGQRSQAGWMTLFGRFAQAKGLQDRGIGFVGSKHLVAGAAILRNHFFVGGGVSAVMTAEAAGIIDVPHIVRVRAPGYFQVRKHVAAIDRQQRLTR